MSTIVESVDFVYVGPIIWVLCAQHGVLAWGTLNPMLGCTGYSWHGDAAVQACCVGWSGALLYSSTYCERGVVGLPLL